MTAKQVYRGALVEMNKTAAPSILLEIRRYTNTLIRSTTFMM